MKLYIGNLSIDKSGEHEGMFRPKVREDVETGRSRGFGFVEMSATVGAEPAVLATGGDIQVFTELLEKPEGIEEQFEMVMKEIGDSRRRTEDNQAIIDDLKVRIDSILESL